jgi:hypothetical protein
VYLILNTISPPKIVTQLPKPNKDLSAGELDDSKLIPKRSARLATKSRHREEKLKAQAQKVMMKCLELKEVETELRDEASFEEF